MIFAGSNDFSIESKISIPLSDLGLRGIGYFLIRIGNKEYGVKDENATALACSYDAVCERIAMRNKHIVPDYLNQYSSLKIAQLVRNMVFDYESIELDNEQTLYMSKNELTDMLYSNKIIWAPDGDEAFDDGSNILQFDIGKKVRIIAYKCFYKNEVDINSLSDIILDADFYYSILNNWANKFLYEWTTACTENNNTKQIRGL